MDSKERDKAVETEKPAIIQYAAFESVQATHEREKKRLWITVIVLIVLLFVTNMIWLGVYASFDYADYEVSADGGSNANYISGGMDGDINNGSKDKSENADTQERSETDQNKSEGAQ